jgi:hypothetical protein
MSNKFMTVGAIRVLLEYGLTRDEVLAMLTACDTTDSALCSDCLDIIADHFDGRPTRDVVRTVVDYIEELGR